MKNKVFNPDDDSLNWQIEIDHKNVRIFRKTAKKTYFWNLVY